ncbi:HAMP domain-containing sensor histidine kinase [Paracoccus sp. Z330]|uniref:histidine kinase n=1 Tax=Paracoccus onchidii TaxID=3017813 RepID=A0ABT4ZGR7_9RHOB|nr:HAMP domain-containing sensor histidine kinase [Paracoccus onchidii]MDB6177885.1 HAMP domain-containing sensor histidine kinase [Paracoccus onchidii]
MKSLRGRLLLLAGVWLSAALLAAFLLISHLLNQFVTDRFDAETFAVADALVGSLGIDSEEEVSLSTLPADPRFGLPFSGWYWQVNSGGRIVARSASLLDGRLTGSTGSYVGGSGTGADGAPLRVLRREITIPDAEEPIAITVTAPQSEIEQSLREIRAPLAFSLIVLGVGLAAASLVQVTAGLRSLDRLGDDLRNVREGKEDRIPLPDVAELQPLTHEINAALDQNATHLSRSRHHLGNLAHSLKTPLAALANELPSDHNGQTLIARMDRLIGWHLRRARQAGPKQMGRRCELRPVIDDILLVLRWPLQDKNMTARIVCPEGATFSGERQDLEEIIGNLAENAVKWGRRQIGITVSFPGDRLVLCIEDDGPGMAQTDVPKAMIRGSRLDEFGLSGSGLGLSIVADLAALHGGELRLERSSMGGLAAIVDLPA